VYHFLEDVAGVHWWNAYEETVPRQPSLRVESLDRKGKPAFRCRDIYMLYANDGGRFAARNRLNRDGDARISSEYGGEMATGRRITCTRFTRTSRRSHISRRIPNGSR